MASTTVQNTLARALRRRPIKKGPGKVPGPRLRHCDVRSWLERVAHHGGRDIHVPRAMDYAPHGVGGAVGVGIVQRVTREQMAVEPQERDVRREVPLETEVELRSPSIAGPRASAADLLRRYSPATARRR